MFGYQVVTDINMVDTETVKRTWRERLLSFPWHPQAAYKTITKPKQEAWIMGNKIVCHPAMWDEIKKQLTEGRE